MSADNIFENTKLKESREIDPNCLFVIERNMNINTVVYSAKLVDGKLDEAEPIHVYWINFAKDISGKDQEELNFVEKKSAYGITFEKGTEPAHVVGNLVCMNKARPLDIFQDDKGVHVIFKVNDEPVKLERIYVMAKSTLGIPKVQYVEIYGTRADDTHVYEKYIP